MNYKSTLPLLVGVLLLCQVSFAQNAYRSRQVASGNTGPTANSWSTVTNWEFFNGITWVVASAYPVSTDDAIEIIAGDSITLSTPITIDQVTVNGILAVFSSTQTLADGAGVDMAVNGILHIGLNGILEGVSSSLQINSTGKLSFLLSGARVHVPTVNNGHAVVSSPATTNTYFENASFTNNGVFTMVSGIITFNNAEFTNNDSLIILSTSPDSYIQTSGTTPVGVVINAAGGVMYKPNTGDFYVNRFVNNGLIKGIGNLDLHTIPTNTGSLEPGNSPGLLSIPYNFFNSKTPTVNLEIVNGSGAGTGHDQVDIPAGMLAPNLSGTTINVTGNAAAPAGDYIVLTTVTAFTGAAPTINVPAGYTATVNPNNITITKLVSLPVVWGDFTGFDESDRVKLVWSTIQEIESSHFVVEHSSDGVHFTAIANIAAAGTSNIETRYTFTHTSPSLTRNNEYRIRQYDLNGKFSYSPTISVKLKNTGRPIVTATPNPVRNSLQIFATKPNYKMTLTDLNGRMLKTLQVAQGAQYLDVNDLPTGTYYLLFTDGENTFTQKLVKMR